MVKRLDTFPNFFLNGHFFHKRIVCESDRREERRYSYDLPQRGMKIPENFIFRTENVDLFHQMRKMTLEELEYFEKRRKSGLEKKLKKERKRK